MPLLARLFFIGLALFFAIVIIRNTRNQRILERESLLWIFVVLLVAILAVDPMLLNRISLALGVAYPPSLLFVVGMLALFLLVFRQTMQLSRLRLELRELTQEQTLLEQRVRELELRNKNAAENFHGEGPTEVI